MSLCLLAFDTSTEICAVALRVNGIDHVAQQPGGALASAALLPAIHALLAAAGRSLRDVETIAFGCGPGAFTGLRTSCAVAQGLAFGVGCPVLAVDSLLIVAEDARRQAGAAVFDVGVLMDARMGEVYAGRYRWAAGGWSTVTPPGLYTPDAIVALWADPPQALAGSALAAFGDRLALAADVPRFAVEHNRAEALLRLATALDEAGAGVDAADALPLYLRDKVALTTAEREAARGAPR